MKLAMELHNFASNLNIVVPASLYVCHQTSVQTVILTGRNFHGSFHGNKLLTAVLFSELLIVFNLKLL